MLILIFQNCTEVNLDIPEVIVKSSVPFKATACPKFKAMDPTNSKFLFVVDMSLSNIGGFYIQELGDGKYYYWRPDQQTDVVGARFDAVEQFIQNCGSDLGNQYAVIGFSGNAITIGEGGQLSTGCDVSFSGPQQSFDTLNLLRQVQTEASEYWKKWIEEYLTESGYPKTMTSTSYGEALECVTNIVTNDIIDPDVDSTTSYHVFFISDGSPEDEKGKGCKKLPEEEQQDCYSDKIGQLTRSLVQIGIAAEKNLYIHSVLYGNVDDIEASRFLNQVAENGQTQSASKLASFEDEPEFFCNMIASRVAVDYQTDFFKAINLSIKGVAGELKVDSDLDGLTDDQELVLFSDPANPRSLVDGVLDGICVRLGGVDACQAKRAEISCTGQLNPMLPSASGLETPQLGYGLTDCDVKILGLDKDVKHPQLGLDTDNDGMLDFVEILKGTDPRYADMVEDADGDGRTNQEEIIQGTDPYINDAPFIDEDLLKLKSTYLGYNIAQLGNTCSQGAWEIDLTQIPGRKSIPSNAQIETQYSHGLNEHVLLFYYRLTPRNSNTEYAEYYGLYLNYKYSEKKDFPYTYKNMEPVTPSDLIPSFQLMGRIQP